MEVVAEGIGIPKKYIVPLSRPMYAGSTVTPRLLSPSRHQDYISPLHCVYPELPEDIVMHESHERDNLCRFNRLGMEREIRIVLHFTLPKYNVG